jgi:hypothetical protein
MKANSLRIFIGIHPNRKLLVFGMWLDTELERNFFLIVHIKPPNSSLEAQAFQKRSKENTARRQHF